MLSLLDKNKAMRFFDWWINGLRLPFTNGECDALVIDYLENQIHIRDSPSSPTKLLSNQDRTALRSARRSNAYLCIPDKAMISTAIADDERHLPLLEIASALLPFDPNELLIGSDPQKTRIFAVLESEVEDSVTAMRDNDIPLTGMAMVDQDEFTYIDVESLRTAERGHRSVKPWMAAGATVMIMVLAAGLYWYAETKKQKKLRQTLAQHQISNATSSESGLPVLLSQPQRPNAQQSYALLRDLLDALPDFSVVDQLILTESELVLDMRAPSASLVKSELDASRKFMSSEFISTISSDRAQNSERFRLQIKLAGDPENVPEAELQND